MRRLTLLVSLVSLSLLGGGASAGAAGQTAGIDLGVAPSKLQMRLVPGQTSRTTLDIFNKGGQAAQLEVYFNDYTISRGSVVQFKPAGSLPESAASWASLGQTVLRLPPHSHRSVTLEMVVPDDAAIGTHTLAVIFRSRQVQTDGNVRYQPAVASLLAAGVQNADGSGLVMDGAASVRKVDVQWLSLGDVAGSSDKVGALTDWLFHPTVVAHVEVRNEGNTFFNILKGGTRFHIGQGAGGRDQQVRAPTYTILPDSVRTVDAEWKKAPWVGAGEATVELYYNDSSALRVAPARIVIVPWHLIMTVGAFLSVFLG